MNLKLKKISFCLVILFLFISWVLLVPPSVFAVFNVTASPSDGGFDLRFSRLSSNDFKQTREVLIRINSDIAKQYRVSQQVIKPLSLSDGTEMPPEQFKMYPLEGSNSQGTLLYREESPVSSFDTVLYTSNPSGDNDSFKIVYTLSPTERQIPGSYFGRIAYVLAPMNSTQDQVVVNVNIYAELAAGATPVIEVTTNSVAGRLSFDSEGMTPKNPQGSKENPQVSVKVYSPLGVSYRIYQGFEGVAPMSAEGEAFDVSDILFTIDGAKTGSAIIDGDLMPAVNRQLLYTSDGFGAPDEFVVTYYPSKNFRLKNAGRYRGKLNFILEKSSSAAPEIVGSFDLDINIVPIFDVYAYSKGKEGIILQFGDVNQKGGGKTSEVEVFVESNIGKPYQVVQKVSGLLMNESADKIPSKNFTLMLKDIGGAEEPKFYCKEATDIKQGEMVLFSSGPKGESAHFKVVYKLLLPSDTKSGSYSTQMGYSLVLN